MRINVCIHQRQTPILYINKGYVGEVDRLCGLVVRVPSYSSRGIGFDSRRY
jgi:hypothetical protein